MDSFDCVLNSRAACYLVELSIRTRKPHTVTCPRNQRPKYHCATVFLNVCFPSPHLEKNYQVLPAFSSCFFSKLRALFKASQFKEFKEDNAPKHSTTAVAMMAIFGTAPMASSSEDSATNTLRGATGWPTAGASTSGAIPVRDQSRANGEAAVEDNPWDGYNTPRPDPSTKVKKRGGDDWICPKHGPMCIPGICTVRARVDRDERWQKEREERAENKRKWMERKARKMEIASAEGRELPHRDQPAWLVNGPREPSSNSRIEGNVDGSHDQGAILIAAVAPAKKEHLSNTYRTSHLTRFVSLPY